MMLLGAQPATISASLLLVPAGLYSLLFVWVFWRHGALAFSLSWFVGTLAVIFPWTLDMSRWYAWRQWCVVAIIAALAVLGVPEHAGEAVRVPRLGAGRITIPAPRASASRGRERLAFAGAWWFEASLSHHTDSSRGATHLCGIAGSRAPK